MDNDVLVDSLEKELDQGDLTPAQKAKLDELVGEGEDRLSDLKEKEREERAIRHPDFGKMREKMKDRWSENFVDHDEYYEEKLAEQSDW